MSDTILRIIPAEPSYVPSLAAQESALRTLRVAFPGADETNVRVFPKVTFVDAGGNFETVFCPHCRREIEHEWWLAAMDQASDIDFSALDVQVPCCGEATTLNALTYAWPQGFARCILEVRNPGAASVPEPVLASIQADLRCNARVIWTRY